jgi:hypothetical protein
VKQYENHAVQAFTRAVKEENVYEIHIAARNLAAYVCDTPESIPVVAKALTRGAEPAGRWASEDVTNQVLETYETDGPE